MDPSGLDDVEIPVDPNDPALQLDPHTVVARLRAAEANPDGAKLSVTEEVLAAIGDQRSLRIGVVDGRGGIEEMLVQPLSLDGGRLRARQVNAESNNASGEKNDGAPESEGGEFTVLIHRVTLG